MLAVDHRHAAHHILHRHHVRHQRHLDDIDHPGDRIAGFPHPIPQTQCRQARSGKLRKTVDDRDQSSIQPYEAARA